MKRIIFISLLFCIACHGKQYKINEKISLSGTIFIFEGEDLVNETKRSFLVFKPQKPITFLGDSIRKPIKSVSLFEIVPDYHSNSKTYDVINTWLKKKRNRMLHVIIEGRINYAETAHYSLEHLFRFSKIIIVDKSIDLKF
jgi:hypothetical protein